MILPDWFTYGLTAVLGLIIGSFANVVIYRLPRDLSIVRPRSRCPSCGVEVRWYDNFPALSYLLLRGRCRACKKTISIRYPVIELLTAILFTAALHRTGWDLFLFIREFPFMFALVSITFIDLDFRIIPDELSLGGLVLGLATAGLGAGPGWIEGFLGAAIGFLVFFLFSWSYKALTGRVGLGGGDVKLLAMLGAFLGVQGVFWTVLISSVVGSLIGVIWALATRQGTIMRASIPYGPFLVLGALVFYLLGSPLWLQFTIPI